MVAAGVAAAAADFAAATAAVVVMVAAAVAALMVAVAADAFAMIAAAPENAPLKAAAEPAEIIAENLRTWSAATEEIGQSVAVRAVFGFAADAMMVIQGQTLQAFASSIVAETKSSAS